MLNLLVITDVEICLCGYVNVQNMVASSKETAQAVLETQVMEVILEANLDSGSVALNPTLVKVKSICENSLDLFSQWT